MLEHKALMKACRELKLNPNKFGENELMADSLILGVIKEPFDLEAIKFPKREFEQVTMIGQIIYNLVSQTVFPLQFDLTTTKGKNDLDRHKSINKIMPLLVESLNYWLQSGLEKTKSSKKLRSYHGKIYEIDSKFAALQEEMNKEMAEVHMDFQRKSSSSWQNAGKIILD